MKPSGTCTLPRLLACRRSGARYIAALGSVLAVAMVTVASAEPRLTFVDLQPKANHGMSEALFGDEDSHFGNVPRGEQKMAETSFRIGDKLICLKGEHAPDFPEKVDGIKVDATFDRLHVLHTTGYGDVGEGLEEGTEIGAYILRYADKTSARVPIRYGEELRDCWDWKDAGVTKARVAWTGTSPSSEQAGRKVRLFAIVRENPHPEKPVATIDIESNATECNPYVFALTLEKK